MTKHILIFLFIISSLNISANRYGVSIGSDINIRSEAKLFSKSVGKINNELEAISIIEVTDIFQEIEINNKKIKAPWIKINYDNKEGYVFGYFIKTYEYKSDADRFIKTNTIKRKEYKGEYLFQDNDKKLFKISIKQNGSIDFSTYNQELNSIGNGRIYVDPIIGELFFYASMTTVIENENKYLEKFNSEYNREPKDDLEFSKYLASFITVWRYEKKINVLKALQYFFPTS